MQAEAWAMVEPKTYGKARFERTFRTLFRTSEAILGKPPVARGGGTLSRLLHAL
jgi:hypothetical protein